MKHTKGQWDVNPTNGNIESGEVTVAIPHGPAGRMIDVSEEHEANAKLIAAAPEMLQALETIMNMATSNDRSHKELWSPFAFMKVAQLAIKNAK